LTPAEDELAHKSDKRARRTVVQTSEKVVRKGSVSTFDASYRPVLLTAPKRSKAKTASLPARVTRSRAAEVVGDES
jgi:hypothetical protein